MSIQLHPIGSGGEGIRSDLSRTTGLPLFPLRGGVGVGTGASAGDRLSTTANPTRLTDCLSSLNLSSRLIRNT